MGDSHGLGGRIDLAQSAVQVHVPNPPSLTDAASAMKVITEHRRDGSYSILINFRSTRSPFDSMPGAQSAENWSGMTRPPSRFCGPQAGVEPNTDPDSPRSEDSIFEC